MNAHAPCAGLADGLAQRNIKIADQPGIDGSLSHCILAHIVNALLGAKSGKRCALSADLDIGAATAVIWADDITYAIEFEIVATDVDCVANVHPHIFLGLVLGDQRNADNEY